MKYLDCARLNYNGSSFTQKKSASVSTLNTKYDGKYYKR